MYKPMQGKYFPKTTKLLEEKNLTLEGNEIQIKDESLQEEENENKRKKKTKTIIKFQLKNNFLEYKFTTAVNSNFKTEKFLKEKTSEYWFKEIKKITETLSKELGLEGIKIKSGRKDRAFLNQNGYKEIENYIFTKKIKT